MLIHEIIIVVILKHHSGKKGAFEWINFEYQFNFFILCSNIHVSSDEDKALSSETSDINKMS